MSEFKIAFEPEIPAARRRHLIVPDWPNIHQAVEAAGLPDIDLTYELAGRRMGYYPASPLDILNDLLGEIAAFERRADHPMGLCGYTVLIVEFRGGQAFFTDPINSYPNGGTPIGEGFNVEQVEAELRNAADAVWELIYPEARPAR